MAIEPLAHDVTDCGCCVGIRPATPRPVVNRPGLSVVAYRSGTWFDFRSSLLAAMSSGEHPELAALTTRSADDFSIALLDAVAAVADVLTFYQERIVTESFLATATERRSVLELARLLGYELRPGVAAETLLAFTVEDAEGAPHVATIDVGVKVQSIPGHEEKPQTFETIEKLDARAVWNAMTPRLSVPQPSPMTAPRIWLDGTGTSLTTGDVLLFVGPGRDAKVDGNDWDARPVTGVIPDFDRDRTEVTLGTGLRETNRMSGIVLAMADQVEVMLQTRAFGAAGTGIAGGLTTAEASAAVSASASAVSSFSSFSGPSSIGPGTGPSAAAVVAAPGPSALATDVGTARLSSFDRRGQVFDDRPSSPTATPVPNPRVYALRTRATVFGQSAADWKVMSKAFKASYMGLAEDDAKVAQQADWPGIESIYRSNPTATVGTIDLDRIHQGIVSQDWLTLVAPDAVELYRVTGATTAGRAQFGLSGSVSRLTINGKNFGSFTKRIRDVAVLGEPHELTLADGPIDAATDTIGAITLDADVGDLPAGRTLLVSGKERTTGTTVSEYVVLDHVERVDGRSRLVFATSLENRYRIDSITIAGNVARATHGETVSEVLGSGDAGRAYQRFTLRQPPLTFVRDSDMPGGASSTLEIRVNDVLWRQVPSFYGLKPTDRVYVSHQADDGTTVVAFGDGAHGARLPTGQENIRAKYRKGVGHGGNLDVGQLSLLLTRPLGLKSASNPVPADGGADPEDRAAARSNAPLTVLTLDRVVSLRDYEDFARAYAGIGKALATWSWDGQRRGVFVTVAGPEGSAIGADVLERLLGAIRSSGDPHVSIRVASYRPMTFSVAFKLKIDPLLEKPAVRLAVVDRLRAAFGFDARAFGQTVNLSEVMATLHGVRGIVAVDVDSLARADGVGGSGLVAPLPAGLPQADSLTGTQPAELLTLGPDPIVPGDMP